MKTANWIDSISLPATPGRVVRWTDALRTWLERARQRQLLARLDDRMLGDIGISRTDALAEADKPFWRE